MRRILLHMVFLSLCGCLSPVPDRSKNWTIGHIKGESSRLVGVKREVVKISRVDVRAPYDGTRLAVLRADGSLAFDSANVFAASPSRLLSGAAYDAVEASGFAATVLDSKTAAPSNLLLELVVTRLALDCRTPGSRSASVEVMLRLLESRKTVSVARAEASVPIDEPDYTKSFSVAFSRAMTEALKRL